MNAHTKTQATKLIIGVLIADAVYAIFFMLSIAVARNPFPCFMMQPSIRCGPDGVWEAVKLVAGNQQPILVLLALANAGIFLLAVPEFRKRPADTSGPES
jgi:hypothetical protein